MGGWMHAYTVGWVAPAAGIVCGSAVVVKYLCV
jgi:hypothetical protein